MSGEEKRSDGLLGERSNERRRAHLAPPVLYTTALLLDSTRQEKDRACARGDRPVAIVKKRLAPDVILYKLLQILKIPDNAHFIGCSDVQSRFNEEIDDCNRLYLFNL